MAPLLEIRNLRTQFSIQNGVVKAVNGISFNMEIGETLGIVGESGSGKSVSMLSVMRLIQPPGKIVGGEVLFEGHNLLDASGTEIRSVRGHKIAMIFQDPMTSLNPVIRIGEQISEALELHLKMDKKKAKARSIELLEMVGIPSAADRAKDYPSQFSGGMRQRVMIAMGLSCNPQLLIADEPTTALDVTIQAQITDLVRRLQNEIGMAIIWITHDLSLVAGLAKRVIVMYAGHIVEESLIMDLYKNPLHPYTMGLLKSVPRLDEGKHAHLFSIEGMTPNLIDYPKGCPFHDRCHYRIDECRNSLPELREVGLQHRIACFVDVTNAQRTTEDPWGDLTRCISYE